MKKKIVIFSFVAALLLCGFAFVAKASDMPPIGPIVYEANDFVWLIDGDTKEKTKIGAGNFPALSDKIGVNPELAKNEVAYVLRKENSHFKASNKEGIYIYNIATGKKKYVKYGVSDVTSQVMWSPNAKYLLVGTHISTYDTKTLITKSGKKKMSFKTIGNQFRWAIDQNEIFYTSFHKVTPYRPRGSAAGLGFGVSKITFSGKKTVLKKPTALIDYVFYGMEEGPQFIKYKVSKQEDWSDSSLYKKSYWMMDNKGKNAVKTFKLVPKADKIAKVLPKKFKDYLVTDFGAPLWNIDFRLFTLDPDPEVVGDEVIYVIQLPHADTLTKITKGNNPSWNWSFN